ncbi:hypothetical protein AAVH_37851, partial [Aphelenchoides avenae]
MDKKELGHFVETFAKRVPRVYKGTKLKKDTVEGANILAEELFKKHDKDGDGRLSYR